MKIHHTHLAVRKQNKRSRGNRHVHLELRHTYIRCGVKSVNVNEIGLGILFI